MDPNEALHRARQAMHAYDHHPHDPFAQHRAAQDLRDAFAALDRLLVHGSPAPVNWATPGAEHADSAWVVFRNSAGHTVAIDHIAADDPQWIRDRVKADHWERPVIVVRIGDARNSPMVIDGWHRILRARDYGTTSLPVVVLDAEEEYRVRIFGGDKVPPPPGGRPPS